MFCLTGGWRMTGSAWTRWTLCNPFYIYKGGSPREGGHWVFSDRTPADDGKRCYSDGRCVPVRKLYYIGRESEGGRAPGSLGTEGRGIFFFRFFALFSSSFFDLDFITIFTRFPLQNQFQNPPFFQFIFDAFFDRIRKTQFSDNRHPSQAKS